MNIGKSNNDIITLYGVGISYLEAAALPRTLERVAINTNAVMLDPPYDENDYFCYMYYMSREDWEDGYAVLMHNFAITSPILYKLEVSLSDLLEGF